MSRDDPNKDWDAHDCCLQIIRFTSVTLQGLNCWLFSKAFSEGAKALSPVHKPIFCRSLVGTWEEALALSPLVGFVTEKLAFARRRSH